MDLILLTGCKRSGKGTAAQALIDRGWVKVSLADPVKELCLAVNPLVERVTRVADLVEAEGWESAKTHPEVRRLLQRIGTEGVREIIGGLTWINLAKEKVRDLRWQGESVVIDDCRFSNEIEHFKEMGGYCVQILRPGCVPDGHASEQPIDPSWIDAVIENTGTVEELHQKVLAAVGEV